MKIISDADIRRRPPKAPATKPEALRSAPIPVPVSLNNGVPIPGSLITREYKGRLLEVLVIDEGFEYAGEKFKSLSAVAKRITTIIDGKLSYGKERMHPMIRHNDPASLGTKAELAFEDACRNVIERARVSNTKIVICRDGIVVKLTPDEAEQELEVNLAKRQDKLLEG